MNGVNTYLSKVFITAISYLLLSIMPVVFAADQTGTTLTPTDDANAGFILEEGQQAASLWKHSYYRFDLSGIEGDISNATFRVYYEEENAPTFFIGGVENDDWTEDGVLPERTLIHDDPAQQLDSKTVNGSGYVEFNVTDFVSSQISSDGIVTLELSANTGGWNIVSSKESDNPPELVISTTVTSSGLTDNANTGFALPEGQLAASKWKHSFFRFDISDIDGDIGNATFRVYYEEENAPTFFIGGVENDDWTEDGVLPDSTLIHDDPALQLASATVTGSGYVEFNVTDFVSSQISSDGVVTLELSASTGSWNIISSSASDNPPELVIDADVIDTAPVVNVTFPTARSLTEGNTVTVRGTASDLNGVANIQVNGQNATSNDGFANWSIVVDLSPGLNTLTVTAIDNDGNRNDQAAEIVIDSNIPLGNLRGLTLDSANNRVLVLRSVHHSRGYTVLAVDLDTGATAIISGGSTPDVTNSLVSPHEMELDSANNRVLVVDQALDAVVAVDLDTGVSTIISDDSTPDSTNSLDYPTGLVLDSANNRVLVVSGGSVLAVDLSTGARTIVSDDNTPDATNPFHSPRGLVLDSANNRALVVDEGLAAVVAVDLSTGARTIISDNNTPAATADFVSPSKLVLDSANNRVLVVDAGLEAMVAVDLSTGARTIISDSNTPDATADFVFLEGLVLDSANNRVLWVSSRFPVLVAVDLSTGARTIISGNSRRHTPDATNGLEFPEIGLMLDSANNRVLFKDRYRSRTVAVDLNTGARTIVSDGFKDPTIQVLDSVNNRVLVADYDLGVVVAVDMDTGARTIFTDFNILVDDDSSGGLGGRSIPYVMPLALDSANNRLLVLVQLLGVMVAVDLSTGDRTIISDWMRIIPNTTNVFGNPVGLALDGANNRAFVLDHGPPAVLVVDLISGERVFLSR